MNATSFAPKNDNATGQGREGVTAADFQLPLCFDGTPKVNPTFPSNKHLPGRVLARLLTGRRYTHLDAWLELSHARLADSIWKLRGMGWPVEMTEKVVSTSDAGRPANIGIYFLSPEVIAATGEYGQEYAAECARIERERRAA